MNQNRTQDGHENHPSDGLLLPGLDGANPLGFLAALGLLRILHGAHALWRLRISWRESSGTWVPVLHSQGSESFDEETILGSLDQYLFRDIAEHPASLISEMKAAENEPARRRTILQDIIEQGDSIRMNWAAALFSDFAATDSINQLQATRRDYFYGNLITIIQKAGREHLRRSMFQPWDYADSLDNQSLHLDPSEDRRHALQWNKPAGDPNRKTHGGMLGANRLALEAMPLFSSFPEANSLHTLGFTGRHSTDTRWTWPIWDFPISLPVVLSLMASPVLQQESLSLSFITLLKDQGIVAVYRTRRILVGKTPNFTPAQGIA